jgi:hypothetical protein
VTSKRMARAGLSLSWSSLHLVSLIWSLY